MTSERQGSLNREDTQQCESMVRAIADGDRDSEREFVQRYLKPVRAMLVARSYGEPRRFTAAAASVLADLRADKRSKPRRTPVRSASR